MEEREESDGDGRQEAERHRKKDEVNRESKLQPSSFIKFCGFLAFAIGLCLESSNLTNHKNEYNF